MMSKIFAVALLLYLVAFAYPIRAEACRNAPDTRLRIDEEAIVADGIRQLNLRSLPAVDTGVETTLRPGIRLTVLSGPSCNGGYNWWRVETEFGHRGWVAEGTWTEYYVVPMRDAGRHIDPLEWTCVFHLSPRFCAIP